MFKRIITALFATLLVVSAAYSQPEKRDICLTRSETLRVQAFKKKAKAKIKILEEQLRHSQAKAKLVCEERVKLVERREKTCIQTLLELQKAPRCPRCFCAIPWIVTGIVAGGCVAGGIAMGVSRR